MQDIIGLSLFCLRQADSTATAWHGAPFDAAVTLNKCLEDKRELSTMQPHQNKIIFVRYEVLTTVTIKSTYSGM
jgi:hypothetical protein